MGMDVRSLEPREVASLLAAMRSTIVAEMRALPDDVLAWHPAPGEWCAKECLGHLMEAERRGFNGRIRTILSHDSGAAELRLPGWDQQAVARERNDCASRAADLLAEFEAIRSDSISLVQGLAAADLQPGGTHEKVGYVRVNDLIHEWLHHDRNHYRQLQANVQAFVWPTMGNCQDR